MGSGTPSNNSKIERPTITSKVFRTTPNAGLH